MAELSSKFTPPNGMMLVCNMYEPYQDIFCDNPNVLINKCLGICKALGLKVLDTQHHVFAPYYGLTVSLIIAESSVTVHTWPEREYARLVIDSCKPMSVIAAMDLVKSYFSPRIVNFDAHKW